MGAGKLCDSFQDGSYFGSGCVIHSPDDPFPCPVFARNAKSHAILFHVHSPFRSAVKSLEQMSARWLSPAPAWVIKCRPCLLRGRCGYFAWKTPLKMEAAYASGFLFTDSGLAIRSPQNGMSSSGNSPVGMSLPSVWLSSAFFLASRILMSVKIASVLKRLTPSLSSHARVFKRPST